MCKSLLKQRTTRSILRPAGYPTTVQYIASSKPTFLLVNSRVRCFLLLVVILIGDVFDDSPPTSLLLRHDVHMKHQLDLGVVYFGRNSGILRLDARGVDGSGIARGELGEQARLQLEYVLPRILLDRNARDLKSFTS